MKGIQKLTALAMAVLYLSGNVALSHAYETNLWAERKKPTRSVQMAQLPDLPRHIDNSRHSGKLLAGIQPFLTTGLQLDPGLRHSGMTNPLLEALPIAYGSVRGVLKPQKSSAGTLIHIQDIHQNEEAQLNISRTVQSLIDNNQVDFVALEGAFGPIDLKMFRDFPHQDAVKIAADYLFKQQEISGPIYSALTSPNEIPSFVGVDDPTHYQKNVQAYRDSRKDADAVKKHVFDMDIALADKKSKIFNAELKKIDDARMAYEKDQMDLGQYIKTLSAFDEDLPMSLALFLEAYQAETKMNFDRAEAERKHLINRLTMSLDQKESEELMNRSVAYRLGNIRQTEFYGALRDLCRKKEVGLEKYPAFHTYIQYVLLADQIQPESVLKDLKVLEKEVFSSLVKTPEESELLAQSVYLNLVAKLLDFSLTREEWGEYKETSPIPSIAQHGGEFLPIVRNGEARRGMDLSSFEAFYEHALHRDTLMAQNTLQAFRESKKKVGVLVTGGFHSAGMTDAFKKAGFTIISYVPKITKVDDLSGSRYLSVFDQEKTSLEELFEGEKLFLAKSPFESPNMAAVFTDTTAERLHLGSNYSIIPAFVSRIVERTANSVAVRLGGEILRVIFGQNNAIERLALVKPSTLDAGRAHGHSDENIRKHFAPAAESLDALRRVKFWKSHEEIDYAHLNRVIEASPFFTRLSKTSSFLPLTTQGSLDYARMDHLLRAQRVALALGKKWQLDEDKIKFFSMVYEMGEIPFSHHLRTKFQSYFSSTKVDRASNLNRALSALFGDSLQAQEFADIRDNALALANRKAVDLTSDEARIILLAHEVVDKVEDTLYAAREGWLENKDALQEEFKRIFGEIDFDEIRTWDISRINERIISFAIEYLNKHAENVSLALSNLQNYQRNHIVRVVFAQQKLRNYDELSKKLGDFIQNLKKNFSEEDVLLRLLQMDDLSIQNNKNPEISSPPQQVAIKLKNEPAQIKRWKGINQIWLGMGISSFLVGVLFALVLADQIPVWLYWAPPVLMPLVSIGWGYVLLALGFNQTLLKKKNPFTYILLNPFFWPFLPAFIGNYWAHRRYNIKNPDAALTNTQSGNTQSRLAVLQELRTIDDIDLLFQKFDRMLASGQFWSAMDENPALAIEVYDHLTSPRNWHRTGEYYLYASGLAKTESGALKKLVESVEAKLSAAIVEKIRIAWNKENYREVFYLYLKLGTRPVVFELFRLLAEVTDLHKKFRITDGAHLNYLDEELPNEKFGAIFINLPEFARLQVTADALGLETAKKALIAVSGIVSGISDWHKQHVLAMSQTPPASWNIQQHLRLLARGGSNEVAATFIVQLARAHSLRSLPNFDNWLNTSTVYTVRRAIYIVKQGNFRRSEVKEAFFAFERDLQIFCESRLTMLIQNAAALDHEQDQQKQLGRALVWAMKSGVNFTSFQHLLKTNGFNDEVLFNPIPGQVTYLYQGVAEEMRAHRMPVGEFLGELHNWWPNAVNQNWVRVLTANLGLSSEYSRRAYAAVFRNIGLHVPPGDARLVRIPTHEAGRALGLSEKEIREHYAPAAESLDALRRLKFWKDHENSNDPNNEENQQKRWAGINDIWKGMLTWTFWTGVGISLGAILLRFTIADQIPVWLYWAPPVLTPLVSIGWGYVLLTVGFNQTLLKKKNPFTYILLNPFFWPFLPAFIGSYLAHRRYNIKNPDAALAQNGENWLSENVPAIVGKKIVEVTMEMALSGPMLKELESKLSPEIVRAVAMGTSTGGIGPLLKERLIAQSELGADVTGVSLLYDYVWTQKITNDPSGQKPPTMTLEKVEIGKHLRSLLDEAGEMDVEMMDGKKIKVKIWKSRPGQYGKGIVYFLDYPPITNVVYPGRVDSKNYENENDLRRAQNWLLGRGTLTLLKSLSKKPDVVVLSEMPTMFAFHKLVDDKFGPDMFFQGTRYVFNDHTPLKYSHPRWTSDEVKKNQIAPRLYENLDLNDEGLLDGTAVMINAVDAVFGVARKHQGVMRAMAPLMQFFEKIRFVTNGVSGSYWPHPDLEHHETQLDSNEKLLAFKRERRHELIRWLARRQGLGDAWAKKMINGNNPVGIWTRRIVEYKRLDRFATLLEDPNKRQRFIDTGIVFVIGGRTHQNDQYGMDQFNRIQRMLQENPILKERVLFFHDYNIWEAPHLFQGADFSVMMADDKYEASATGFQKAQMNGALIIASNDGAVPESVVFLNDDGSNTNEANGFEVPYVSEHPTDEGLMRGFEQFMEVFRASDRHAQMIRNALRKTSFLSVKRTAQDMLRFLGAMVIRKDQERSAEQEGKQAAFTEFKIPDLSENRLREIRAKLDQAPGFNWTYQEKGLKPTALVMGQQGLRGFVESAKDIRGKGTAGEWSLLYHAFNHSGVGDLAVYLRDVFKDIPELAPVVEKINEWSAESQGGQGNEDKLYASLKILGLVEQVTKSLYNSGAAFVLPSTLDAGRALGLSDEQIRTKYAPAIEALDTLRPWRFWRAHEALKDGGQSKRIRGIAQIWLAMIGTAALPGALISLGAAVAAMVAQNQIPLWLYWALPIVTAASSILWGEGLRLSRKSRDLREARDPFTVIFSPVFWPFLPAFIGNYWAHRRYNIKNPDAALTINRVDPNGFWDALLKSRTLREQVARRRLSTAVYASATNDRGVLDLTEELFRQLENEGLIQPSEYLSGLQYYELTEKGRQTYEQYRKSKGSHQELVVKGQLSPHEQLYRDLLENFHLKKLAEKGTLTVLAIIQSGISKESIPIVRKRLSKLVKEGKLTKSGDKKFTYKLSGSPSSALSWVNLVLAVILTPLAMDWFATLMFHVPIFTKMNLVLFSGIAILVAFAFHECSHLIFSEQPEEWHRWTWTPGWMGGFSIPDSPGFAGIVGSLFGAIVSVALAFFDVLPLAFVGGFFTANVIFMFSLMDWADVLPKQVKHLFWNNGRFLKQVEDDIVTRLIADLAIPDFLIIKTTMGGMDVNHNAVENYVQAALNGKEIWAKNKKKVVESAVRRYVAMVEAPILVQLNSQSRNVTTFRSTFLGPVHIVLRTNLKEPEEGMKYVFEKMPDGSFQLQKFNTGRKRESVPNDEGFHLSYFEEKVQDGEAKVPMDQKYHLDDRLWIWVKNENGIDVVIIGNSHPNRLTMVRLNRPKLDEGKKPSYAEYRLSPRISILSDQDAGQLQRAFNYGHFGVKDNSIVLRGRIGQYPINWYLRHSSKNDVAVDDDGVRYFLHRLALMEVSSDISRAASVVAEYDWRLQTVVGSVNIPMKNLQGFDLFYEDGPVVLQFPNYQWVIKRNSQGEFQLVRQNEDGTSDVIEVGPNIAIPLTLDSNEPAIRLVTSDMRGVGNALRITNLSGAPFSIVMQSYGNPIFFERVRRLKGQASLVKPSTRKAGERHGLTEDKILKHFAPSGESLDALRRLKFWNDHDDPSDPINNEKQDRRWKGINQIWLGMGISSFVVGVLLALVLADQIPVWLYWAPPVLMPFVSVSWGYYVLLPLGFNQTLLKKKNPFTYVFKNPFFWLFIPAFLGSYIAHRRYNIKNPDAALLQAPDDKPRLYDLVITQFSERKAGHIIKPNLNKKEQHAFGELLPYILSAFKKTTKIANQTLDQDDKDAFLKKAVENLFKAPNEFFVIWTRMGLVPREIDLKAMLMSTNPTSVSVWVVLVLVRLDKSLAQLFPQENTHIQKILDGPAPLLRFTLFLAAYVYLYTAVQPKDEEERSELTDQLITAAFNASRSFIYTDRISNVANSLNRVIPDIKNESVKIKKQYLIAVYSSQENKKNRKIDNILEELTNAGVIFAELSEDLKVKFLTLVYRWVINAVPVLTPDIIQEFKASSNPPPPALVLSPSIITLWMEILGRTILALWFVPLVLTLVACDAIKNAQFSPYVRDSHGSTQVGIKGYGALSGLDILNGFDSDKKRLEDLADAIVNAFDSVSANNINQVIVSERSIGMGRRPGALTGLSTQDRDEVLRLVEEKLREQRNSSSPNGFVGDPFSWMQSRGVITQLDGIESQDPASLIGNKNVALDVRVQAQDDLDAAVALINKTKRSMGQGILYVPVRASLEADLKARLIATLGSVDNKIQLVVSPEGFYEAGKFNLDTFLPAMKSQLQSDELGDVLLAISGDYTVSDATWAEYNGRLNLKMILLVELLNGAFRAMPMDHATLQNIDRFARLAATAA